MDESFISWAEAPRCSPQSEIPFSDSGNAFIPSSLSDAYDDSQLPDNLLSEFGIFDIYEMTDREIRNGEEQHQAVRNVSEHPILSSPLEGTTPQDIRAVLTTSNSHEDQQLTRADPYSYESPLSVKNPDFKKNPKVMRDFWMKGLGRFLDNNKTLQFFGKHLKGKGTTERREAREIPAKFKCPIAGCGDDFTKKHNLENHLRSHCGVTDLICPKCWRGFTTIPVYKRHSKTCQKAGKAKQPPAWGI